jgi:hypothetical protein
LIYSNDAVPGAPYPSETAVLVPQVPAANLINPVVLGYCKSNTKLSIGLESKRYDFISALDPSYGYSLNTRLKESIKYFSADPYLA